MLPGIRALVRSRPAREGSSMPSTTARAAPPEAKPSRWLRSFGTEVSTGSRPSAVPGF